jgi:hypothetical protein
MPDDHAVQARIRRNQAARAEDRRRDLGRSMPERLDGPPRLSRIAAELAMNLSRMFAPDELIAALADGGVEDALIGGLAVGAHGFPRATKDVDIVPASPPRTRGPPPGLDGRACAVQP